jgi:tricorn protease-like protein
MGRRSSSSARPDPDGDTTHASGLFIVKSDGSDLRQLNPPGTKVGFVGRHAALGVDEAVFVVDVDGGQARQITHRGGFVWAVSWSPTGEWITYTRFHGTTTVISLVRPDGIDQREISANDESHEAPLACGRRTGIIYWSNATAIRPSTARATSG